MSRFDTSVLQSSVATFVSVTDSAFLEAPKPSKGASSLSPPSSSSTNKLGRSLSQSYEHVAGQPHDSECSRLSRVGSPLPFEYRPSSAADFTLPGYTSPEAEAIDRWFEDLSQQEELLEQMARTKTDLGFVQELEAINTWFEALSDNERLAAIYSLLSHLNMVQDRFFLKVLKQKVDAAQEALENRGNVLKDLGKRVISRRSFTLSDKEKRDLVKIDLSNEIGDLSLYRHRANEFVSALGTVDSPIVSIPTTTSYSSLQTSLSSFSSAVGSTISPTSTTSVIGGAPGFPPSTNRPLTPVQTASSHTSSPLSPRNTSSAFPSPNFKAGSAMFAPTDLKLSDLSSVAQHGLSTTSSPSSYGMQRPIKPSSQYAFQPTIQKTSPNATDFVSFKSYHNPPNYQKNRHIHSTTTTISNFKSADYDYHSSASENIHLELLHDIPAWLKSLRLHKYAPVFDGMSWQNMIVLDEAALEQIGVTALGARRKFLKLFAQIKEKQGSVALN